MLIGYFPMNNVLQIQSHQDNVVRTLKTLLGKSPSPIILKVRTTTNRKSDPITQTKYP